jgi:pimeloyl-ACP methyl ester carboxylesterase
MYRLVTLLVMCLILFSVAPVSAQETDAIIRVLDRKGAEISSLIDGNAIQLSVKLPGKVTTSSKAGFFIDGYPNWVADCSLDVGADSCTSAVFPALGWYWAADGVSKPQRTIHARINGEDVPGSQTILVRPRPVVMVHGFISSWETWKPYLGSDGYLASIELDGFAVGDGQFPGVLNTGDPSNPESKTNSIAQNSEILGQYIAAVQKKTGAEKVDLLVHSMGGMISRFYIDRVMQTDNVAQIIFLGTPMSGSACVQPLAALGYLLPASLEILPDYMTHIFNQQIVHRHGVPFHMVAGTLLIDPLTSPCADAPSDTVVALDSATSIALDDVQELPMFHGSLTSDKQVFDENVRHLLQALPGSFAARPDPAAPSVNTQPEQFSRVYTGHLKPGEAAPVTIDIDPNVSLANFSLYDSSRSLDIEVRGASGNLIQLDTAKNGILKIDDPSVMLYLGYGFKQPKPGKWVITLKTTDKTPPQGADYALNARFMGGATLTATCDPTIPNLGQMLTLKATLQADGANLTIDSAQALVRKPDGTQETVALSLNGDAYSAEYRPQQSGLYSAEIVLSGKNADGFGIDRAATLTFEAQPGKQEIDDSRWIALGIFIGVVLLIVLFVVFRRRKRV